MSLLSTKFPRSSGIFTERLSMDTHLPLEVEMLDALFEHSTEGIIICDKTGSIMRSNPAAAKMFGYTLEELKNNRIEILLPKRIRDQHVKLREGYTQNPVPRSMGAGRDLRGLRKDGSEIPVEVSLSPFSTGKGEFIMSFIVDITLRKKNEMELYFTNERLQQTSEALSKLNSELESKVSARTEELAEAIRNLADSKREVMRALEREKELNELKSRFVTTASHEFRTPLGTILSSVSLIGRYDSDEEKEKRHKHIERIKAAVTNLTEILNDFLSIEKLEEGIIRYNPEEVDFEKLVNNIADDMRGVAKNGQTIEVQYSGKPVMLLDKQLMRNVLINLTSNAIKYSPEEKPIVIRINAEDGVLRVEVEDRGIGIPDEEQPNIFERFYRAKNSGNVQGTGLGLSIVKKYVEIMDGQLSFASRLDDGTTFTVELPTR